MIFIFFSNIISYGKKCLFKGTKLLISQTLIALKKSAFQCLIFFFLDFFRVVLLRHVFTSFILMYFPFLFSFILFLSSWNFSSRLVLYWMTTQREKSNIHRHHLQFFVFLPNTSFYFWLLTHAPVCHQFLKKCFGFFFLSSYTRYVDVVVQALVAVSRYIIFYFIVYNSGLFLFLAKNNRNSF